MRNALPRDPVRVVTLNLLPVEQHLPLATVERATRRFEQCRLARTVGAKHCNDLALINAQTHATNGHDRPIEGLDIAQLE